MCLTPFKEKNIKDPSHPGQDAQPMVTIGIPIINDKKWSITIWQNGHSDCMQTVNGGESREMMGHADMFCGNGCWQQPLEKTASTGNNEKFQKH